MMTRRNAWFQDPPVVDIDRTTESIRLTSVTNAMALNEPDPLRYSPGPIKRYKNQNLLANRKFDPLSTDNDLVSWVHLLATLQWSAELQSKQATAQFKPTLVPAMQISQRSWADASGKFCGL